MFSFVTAGNSHGPGLTVIVQGVPAGLPLTEEYIARDLRRRQGGFGRGGRMKIESDYARITSGVRHGLTMGGPIAAPVERVTRLRPGHADLPGTIKYGFDDVRPVLERASARETAARVAAGAIARRLLEEFAIEIHSHVVAIGDVEAPPVDEPDWEAVEASDVRCADPDTAERMRAKILEAKHRHDTVGGIIEVRVRGCPIGLGSHVQWDRKLDGRLAQAILSINAFKGVEFGAGFAATRAFGSETHDVILPASHWEGRPWRHATNRHGGIEGGMTTGEEIVLRAAIKPIPTLANPLPSVDLDTGDE